MTYEEFQQKWNFIPECNEGWLEIIDTAFTAMGHNFTYSQVKEKFGGLRIYGNFDERQFAVKLLAEDLSFHICDICGKSGKIRVYNGCYATRCEEHMASKNALKAASRSTISYSVGANTIFTNAERAESV